MSLALATKHLDKNMAVNLGSFYTPQSLVTKAYGLMQKHINDLDSYIFLDTSCGYGDFFTQNFRYIGADIDKIALQKAQNATKIIHTNSLIGVCREKFEIKHDDKLIIIGNPPYNDKTSQLQARIKKAMFECDELLKSRDLGISFLRSYALLEGEFVCVLHPLSYLIKKTNFEALRDFKAQYRLIDSLIVSSQFFTPNSNAFFPIIIALYQKNAKGMDYDFIQNYRFKTIEGQSFCLNDFDFIANYVSKYPNPNDKRNAVAYFYTLRDINALKRNQTFMQGQSANAIKVFSENLKYYIYIHFFKAYCRNLPYFLGNLDIFIDNESFLKIEDEFLAWFYKKPFDEFKIQCYFNALFGRFGVNK